MTDSTPDAEGSAPEKAPDPSELIGTTLVGRYKMVRRLGVGGMGAVYLGEHLRMGRKDAIKVLRAELARDPEALARFSRGARAVAQIRHPNVCQVYDFGETDEGLLFLAMEFIDGPSLSELLEEEGRLKPDRAVRFMEQAAAALHVAHGLGIIHRDLKPDNLMIGRAGDGSEQLKVVDFDIARGKEEEGAGVTRQGFVVGTPEYMSPEQLTGDPLDARSDVYSLALVLFRCLSGRLPFEGTTAQEAMIQRLKVEPLRLSQAAPGRSFPDGLEAIIHDALSKFPDERPASAPDFARALAATLSAGPAAAETTVAEAADPDAATQIAPAITPPAASGADDATRIAPAVSSPAGSGPTPSHRSADPAAMAEAAGDAVPATLVTSSSGDGAAWTKSRKAMAVGGTAGLAALLVTGFLVLAPDFGTAGGARPTAGDSLTSVADANVDAPSAEDAAGTGAEAPAGGQSTNTQPTDPQSTERQSSTERSSPERQPVEPQTERSSSLDTGARTAAVEAPVAGADAPVAGARPVDLPADPGDLQQLLYDQWRLQAENSDDRAAVTAARDTAAAVWAFSGATREDRAFAANILGLTLILLGNSSGGVDWLEEAVELDPDTERYQTALQAHRQSAR